MLFVQRWSDFFAMSLCYSVTVVGLFAMSPFCTCDSGRLVCDVTILNLFAMSLCYSAVCVVLFCSLISGGRIVYLRCASAVVRWWSDCLYCRYAACSAIVHTYPNDHFFLMSTCCGRISRNIYLYICLWYQVALA